MLNYIFLALKQRLNTLSELREVDWFNNQYDESEQEQIMYAAPACYLEFMNVATSSSKKKRIQSGLVQFRAHIVTELYQDNDQRFVSAALDHYDVVNVVYSHLLGYNTKLSDLAGQEALLNTPQDYQLFNSITRTGIEPDHKTGRFMLTIQTFTMLGYDFSAKKTYSKIQVPVSITTSISQTL